MLAGLVPRVKVHMETMEVTILVQTLLSFGRLATGALTTKAALHPAVDVELLSALELALVSEVHRLPVKSLPGILDAIVSLYFAIGAEQLGESFFTVERRRFIVGLTGALARSLEQVRPQDACRALQALDHLGVMDPLLLEITLSYVPSRLATLPPKLLLGLLESYAASGNVDGLMVPCLRQALLPALQAHDARSSFDTAALDQLDDISVAHACEMFAHLRHTTGVLALVASLERPIGSNSPRRLASICELAVATTVLTVFPSAEAWTEAVAGFLKAEPNMPRVTLEVLDASTWTSWCSAQAATTDADVLLLALGAFPTHTGRPEWEGSLTERLAGGEGSTALLPALLLHRAPGCSESLAGVATEALVKRLSANAAADLPAAVVVAAARALAFRGFGRSSCGEVMAVDIRDGCQRLMTRAIELVMLGSLPTKGLVRLLQAAQSLDVPPPKALVEALGRDCGVLSPEELLAALRALPKRSRPPMQTDAGQQLAAAATRALAQFRSSRQAWELQALCTRLELDLGEVDRSAVVSPDGDEAAAPGAA